MLDGDPVPSGGVLHIRVGTAGLDHLSYWANGEQPAWSAYRELSYGYGRLTLTPVGGLTFQFVRTGERGIHMRGSHASRGVADTLTLSLHHTESVRDTQKDDNSARCVKKSVCPHARERARTHTHPLSQAEPALTPLIVFPGSAEFVPYDLSAGILHMHDGTQVEPLENEAILISHSSHSCHTPEVATLMIHQISTFGLAPSQTNITDEKRSEV